MDKAGLSQHRASVRTVLSPYINVCATFTILYSIALQKKKKSACIIDFQQLWRAKAENFFKHNQSAICQCHKPLRESAPSKSSWKNTQELSPPSSLPLSPWRAPLTVHNNALLTVRAIAPMAITATIPNEIWFYDFLITHPTPTPNLFAELLRPLAPSDAIWPQRSSHLLSSTYPPLLPCHSNEPPNKLLLFCHPGLTPVAMTDQTAARAQGLRPRPIL